MAQVVHDTGVIGALPRGDLHRLFRLAASAVVSALFVVAGLFAIGLWLQYAPAVWFGAVLACITGVACAVMLLCWRWMRASAPPRRVPMALGLIGIAMAGFAILVPIRSLAEGFNGAFYLSTGLIAAYGGLIAGLSVAFRCLLSELALDQVRFRRQREMLSQLIFTRQGDAREWGWQTDATHRLVQVSAGPGSGDEPPMADLTGVPLPALLAQEDLSADDAASVRDLTHNLEAHKAFRALVVPVSVRGRSMWWSLTAHPRFDATGTFLGFLGAGTDVTETRNAESRAEFLMHYDALTGLPNRNVGLMRIAEAASRMRQGADGYAVLRINLDGLKAINVTFGHEAGDHVLAECARRLVAQVPAGDSVARVGGDEFLVVASGLSEADAEELAADIRTTIAMPFDLGRDTGSVDATIGIVMGEDAGADVILRKADLALQSARIDGRGGVQMYRPELVGHMQTRRQLEVELRQALERGEFELHFQPIVSFGETQITSFEALLRWRNPTLGLVSPSDFVPVAEEIGVIDAIGEWVIGEACRAAMRWPSHIRVAVNLSVRQLRQTTFGLTVARCLMESGLNPDRLELEITESVFMGQNEAVISMLHELRKLGVRIALDDFGTGYSSLSYLQMFPFDKIKIDQSFVRTLCDGKDARVIIEAISMLAAHFGMTVTAEGVETQDQVRQLADIGCGELQGFLISEPEPASRIPIIIERIRGREMGTVPVLRPH